MMNFPLTSSAGAFAGVVLALGYGAAEDALSPLDDILFPVDLQSVEYVPGPDGAPGSVDYHRVVNWPSSVLAPWAATVLIDGTETIVEGCNASGRAPYGPDEPERQTFPMSAFTTPECEAILRRLGESYVLIAQVSPLQGPGDEVRSDVFTVE